LVLRDIKHFVSERRRYPRKRTLQPANIVGADNESTMVCVVLDWSHGGARLHPDDPNGCPDHFTLVTQDGRWMACQVVWRQDGQIGVKFLKALKVKA
jgi:hypothetical protein